ncbi:CRPV-016 [Crowpox virus]|nr:CRPV-016 [Crowpox virus]
MNIISTTILGVYHILILAISLTTVSKVHNIIHGLHEKDIEIETLLHKTTLCSK